MRFQRLKQALIISAAVVVLAGCFYRKGPDELHYLGGDGPDYYKDVATSIEFPTTEEERPAQVTVTGQPHTIANRQKDQVWDLTLSQALEMALANNKIIRSAGSFDAPGNALMTNPNAVESVYDSAINESGVLFGGRGVEAALSDFDAQLAVSNTFGFNQNVVNSPSQNIGAGAGTVLEQHTGLFNATLTKTFVNGGQIQFQNQWNYLDVNSNSVLFPSSYSGFAKVSYTQPLWAASGVEFTRTAGVVNSAFAAVTGVSQGVAISRINEDMALADFELAALLLLRDTENTYWNLYLQYRLYHTAVVAHNSALRSWREAKAKLDIGGATGFTPVDEATARDQLYNTRATAETNLNNLYNAETALRRLLGLPVNDGRIIRPVDEPPIAKFVPEWYTCLTEGLTRRSELRKQKWQIKSLELQLRAAKSLVHPSLNFVGSYQVNGFGNDLISQQSQIAQPFSSAFGSLAEANQTGWTAGFQFTMPIGFRAAWSQVRQYEVRVAKAREGLAVQEMEIAQELAVAFQNVAVNYQTAQSYFNRRLATERELALYEYQYEVGTTTLSFVLTAQSNLASAESSYYTSLVNYAEAIMDLNFRKGTLLDYHNVTLAESDWTPEAYKDAIRHAWARSHAIPAKFLCTEPEENQLPPGVETLQQPQVQPATGPAAAAVPPPPAAAPPAASSSAGTPGAGSPPPPAPPAAMPAPSAAPVLPSPAPVMKPSNATP
ncbi:MAG TPA: TolC family protein [Planctomycetaceae bacterium]|jgi:outer membrane protein TolC|nr:TolC family protein [Planctomycetaceae bacterium]